MAPEWDPANDEVRLTLFFSLPYKTSGLTVPKPRRSIVTHLCSVAGGTAVTESWEGQAFSNTCFYVLFLWSLGLLCAVLC